MYQMIAQIKHENVSQMQINIQRKGDLKHDKLAERRRKKKIWRLIRKG